MQLQKGPLGILGWFALKVTGRNPPAFGDAVVPVVEVGDNYLATSELQMQTSLIPSTLTVSQTILFTVPAGKCWRLIGAGGYLTLNVADAGFVVVGSVGVRSPNSAPNDGYVFTQTTGQTAGNARVFGAAFRPPIFLPSGWSVAISTVRSAAVTVASFQYAVITYQEIDL